MKTSCPNCKSTKTRKSNLKFLLDDGVLHIMNCSCCIQDFQFIEYFDGTSEVIVWNDEKPNFKLDLN